MVRWLTSPLRHWRNRRIEHGVRRLQAEYGDPADPRAAEVAILERLNAQWQHAADRLPHVRDLIAGGVPERFAKLEEYREVVPIVERVDLRGELPRFRDTAIDAVAVRRTGGSTSEPLAIPIGRAEQQRAGLEIWRARAALGIRPGDRLSMIWGHAHLFGTGLRGRVNRWTRRAADAVLGYHRFSAYDLTDANLRRCADEMLRFRPAYMIGYSVALDAFASVNGDRARELKALGLKAVIATAEGFPAPDSRDRLEALFGCPVVMEYGAVETGVIAHERTSGDFRVNCLSLLVEVDATGRMGEGDLLVTSLTPRAVPLFRYRIGDRVRACPDVPAHQRFAAVIGRCNDYIELADGSRIHSEAFSHAIRADDAVQQFQVVQVGSTLPTIRLRCLPGAEPDRAGISRALARLHADLGEAPVRSDQPFERTIAGKTSSICRLDAANGNKASKGV